MLDPAGALAVLADEGMLLQSARGPIANVAERVAGEPIRGSWWGHPAGPAIFAALQALDGSPDVVRVRLVRGKVTFVHRRLWAALVRVAPELPPGALDALAEEHTPSGAHRVSTLPFPGWVPPEVVAAADELGADEAWAALPACLRPGQAKPSRKSV